MQNHSTLQEQEIIKACQKGVAVGQEQLYRNFLPYVVSICRRYGIQESDLKDAVQEVFIEIYISIKKYRPTKGPFKPWLKTVAIRKLIKLQKGQSKLHIVHFDQIAPKNEQKIDSALAKVQAEEILHILQALPSGYRKIFNLYVIDGYDHKEIGQLLGISEVGSRSQLSRAKRMIRDQLNQIKKQQHEII